MSLSAVTSPPFLLHRFSHNPSHDTRWTVWALSTVRILLFNSSFPRFGTLVTIPLNSLPAGIKASWISPALSPFSPFRPTPTHLQHTFFFHPLLPTHPQSQHSKQHNTTTHLQEEANSNPKLFSPQSSSPLQNHTIELRKQATISQAPPNTPITPSSTMNMYPFYPNMLNCIGAPRSPREQQQQQQQEQQQQQPAANLGMSQPPTATPYLEVPLSDPYTLAIFPSSLPSSGIYPPPQDASVSSSFFGDFHPPPAAPAPPPQGYILPDPYLDLSLPPLSGSTYLVGPAGPPPPYTPAEPYLGDPSLGGPYPGYFGSGAPTLPIVPPTTTTAPAPAPQRRRGRPPGSKDKVQRSTKGKGPAEHLVPKYNRAGRPTKEQAAAAAQHKALRAMLVEKRDASEEELRELGRLAAVGKVSQKRR